MHQPTLYVKFIFPMQNLWIHSIQIHLIRIQIQNANKLLRQDVTGSKNIFSWFNMNFLNIFPSQSICMLNRKNNMKNSFVSFICRLSISLTTSVDHKRLSTAQNTCEKILFLSEAVEAVFYTPQQWDHLCRHSKRNEILCLWQFSKHSIRKLFSSLRDDPNHFQFLEFLCLFV